MRVCKVYFLFKVLQNYISFLNALIDKRFAYIYFMLPSSFIIATHINFFLIRYLLMRHRKFVYLNEINNHNATGVNY